MLSGPFAFTGGKSNFSLEKTQMHQGVTSHGRALFVFASCCWGSFSHLTTQTYPKWADSNIWSLEESKISDHKENKQNNTPHTCAFPCVSKTHLRSQRDKGLFVSNDAQSTTHHCHHLISFSLLLLRWTDDQVQEQKWNPLKNNHFQTNRILDCMTTQRVLCKGAERVGMTLH